MAIYRDYSGPKTFDTLAELAAFRVDNPAPLMGGARSQADFNFAVSLDNGETWVKPSDCERGVLAQHIKAITKA